MLCVISEIIGLNACLCCLACLITCKTWLETICWLAQKILVGLKLSFFSWVMCAQQNNLCGTISFGLVWSLVVRLVGGLPSLWLQSTLSSLKRFWSAGWMIFCEHHQQHIYSDNGIMSAKNLHLNHLNEVGDGEGDLHLDHVEEVGDGLLFNNRQGVKVTAEGIRKLCFVQPWSTCHLRKAKVR